MDKSLNLFWCKYIYVCMFLPFFFFTISCSEFKNRPDKKLFEKISAADSGIHFANILQENDSINYFEYMYIYMGGGVAIGDLNNDGLPDIYFTGNMTENKLYLNKGDLTFEDITQEANVGGDDRWVTGVTMGDANEDGWLDIYVSVSGKWTTTKNLLYINDAKHGEIPTFTEAAEEYGVADTGNSTQAVFFDYDLDGDQDLYVVNYPLVSSRTSISAFLNFRYNAPYDKSDRLYRNDGNNKFTDVTQQLGLNKYGLSLGVSVGDYNQDGWPDIYVSNDFSTPDYFLINNKDGTFTDQNLNLTNHTSYFGMGTDVADFNNDGLLDLYQVDMMPKSHRRAKENMDSMDPERFYNMVDHDMHYQYSINTLQLNMGNDSIGLPHFGDIAKIAGVSSTDWSWASIFADFDNDGLKDIYVTNGVRRDINNSDYFRSDALQNFKNENPLDLTLKIPSEKIDNFAFKNNGDLTFANVSEEWGINYNGFSNGVAYADLDNDGDLDLVLNNLDDTSVVYENKTSDNKTNNYLRIKFEGPKTNALGLGCKIWLEDNGETQFQEMTLSRGFQSSVEPIAHFGVGTKENIKKVKVLWQDGKEEILNDISANQLLTVNYINASNPKSGTESIKKTSYFEDITKKVGLQYKHEENNFDDFSYQVLLPHKISQYGPALAVGDIDNDGLDDFYIGGANRSPGALFKQNTNGTFSKFSDNVWNMDKDQEDVSSAFFDANGDGLLDLYVVCGGNEYGKENKYYQDKFYLNKGAGVFVKDDQALPIMTTSGSTVVPTDYDNDGDIDLFVGGRITPRNYPAAPKSYILRNDSNKEGVKFVDVTEEIAPALSNLGMVTQAEWIDIDGDDKKDLVLIGEWMGITYLKNINGKFVNKSDSAGFADTTGWWFGMTSCDFDKDGDIDFIMGNLGENYKYQAHEDEPFSLYTYDYDNNGKNDIVLSKIEKGTQIPVRGRECSSQQIPAIKTKFKDYHSFATASLEEIYSTEHLQKSTHYEIKSFAHSYVENIGNGKFKFHPMDNLAQIAPINSMATHDINKDSNLDVIYAGNLYGSEVETPRGDAGYGGLLLGDGNGGLKSTMPYETGLMIKGEVKSVKKLRLANGSTGILFAKNNDYLQLLKIL
ncbi:VCBS repeat-containing protein [Arenibacter troitsensis]|nr:VCBS repeat-containing protein [Arenibacter troitsensis]